MSEVKIFAGRYRYTIPREELKQSRLLDSIAQGADRIYIERNPELLQCILFWIREQRLPGINCPSDAFWSRMLEEAIHYDVPSLVEFLRNRVNLCGYLYLSAPDGIYLANLDDFRALEFPPVWIRDILDGKVEFESPNTAKYPMPLKLRANYLRAPLESRVFTATVPLRKKLRRYARAALGEENITIDGDCVYYQPRISN